MRRVMAVAHRGYSGAAPENTIAAFRKALDLRPDMMECDVRRTKDGSLVVIHDPTVDRTTNGTGKVADMILEEIRALDAGSWFSQEFAGERIPTLEEFLDTFRNTVKLIIEIKEEGTEDQVVAEVRSRGMSDQVLLTSFHYRVGVRLPELDPEIKFQPLIYLPERPSEEEAVRLADEAAAVNGIMFGVNYKAINPPLVRATHAANMRLLAWTVDTEEDIRAMAKTGVDAIAGNQLGLLLETLGA